MAVENNPQTTFPGKGNPKEAELHALCKELAWVKQECDILKKAMGHFAKIPE